MEPTTPILCAHCGGPLAPPPGELRFACPFCGTVNDIASRGAVVVAKKLEAIGVRMPDRPMTLAEIEGDIAEREARRLEARRSAMIVLGVIAAIAMLVGVVAALST